MRGAQLLIALTVFFANIRFGWVENGYLVAVWAFCAAYGFTFIVVKLTGWIDAN